jgi:hypothetical protein
MYWLVIMWFHLSSIYYKIVIFIWIPRDLNQNYVKAFISRNTEDALPPISYCSQTRLNLKLWNISIECNKDSENFNLKSLLNFFQFEVFNSNSYLNSTEFLWHQIPDYSTNGLLLRNFQEHVIIHTFWKLVRNSIRKL